MDSFQMFGKYDVNAKLWLIDVDPERDHSAFATGLTLGEATGKAMDMLFETRRFRREKCSESLIGPDGDEHRADSPKPTSATSCGPSQPLTEGESVRQTELLSSPSVQELASEILYHVTKCEGPTEEDFIAWLAQRLEAYTRERVEAAMLERLRWTWEHDGEPWPYEFEVLKLLAELCNRDFERAHALRHCGHSVGDYRDAGYIPGKPETYTANESCVGCEREDAARREERERLCYGNPPLDVFLDWLGDRLEKVYGENANVDFVQACHRRAEQIRASKPTGGAS